MSKQLRDRINTQCDFQASTLDDVSLACAQLSEVPIAPDLVTHILKQTEGCMRLVMNAIARIEGAARMRNTDSRTVPMGMNDIKGAELFKGLVRPGRKGVSA